MATSVYGCIVTVAVSTRERCCAVRRDQCDARRHPVCPTAQEPEHPRAVRRIPWLAENQPVHRHERIRAEDVRARMPCRDLPCLDEREQLRATSSGETPAGGVSSAPLGSTMKGMPRRPSSSRRRGDPEARTSGGCAHARSYTVCSVRSVNPSDVREADRRLVLRVDGQHGLFAALVQNRADQAVRTLPREAVAPRPLDRVGGDRVIALGFARCQARETSSARR